MRQVLIVGLLGLSACSSEPPRNIPEPAKAVYREAAKHEPVRRAAYQGYQAVQSGDQAISDMAVTPDEIQGALLALVNRALTGLDGLKAQVDAFEVEYQQFKSSVTSEFDAVWTKLNNVDRTLQEFIPAVNLRFESLESRVDRLEQAQPMQRRRIVREY